jgi:hypothetical protein
MTLVTSRQNSKDYKIVYQKEKKKTNKQCLSYIMTNLKGLQAGVAKETEQMLLLMCVSTVVGSNDLIVVV